MDSWIPSAGQQAAHDMVGAFLAQDKYRVGVITGYAGTGKTTLIRMLAESYGRPTVLTPTGKAALRVGEATGIHASTIHRFLYTPQEDPRTGAPVFKLKDAWDETFADMEGKLVLVDEASMVPADVWADLYSVAVHVRFHVLLMGDTFQLPPVYKDKSGTPFSTLVDIETPFRVHLTEVIRQALDSPIIRSSMMLREGKPEYEALDLLDAVGASQLIEETIKTRAAGGVTICFANSRRHDVNNRVREKLGFAPGTLQAGEPLLVTQNNYALDLYNGEVADFEGWLVSPATDCLVVDRHSSVSMPVHFGVARVGDGKATMAVEQVTGLTDAKGVGAWNVRRAGRGWYKDLYDCERAAPHLDANYGYALTCHKSQGSEWPEVLIVMEPSLRMLGTRERARWLYTAETRAKQRAKYIFLKE